MNRLDFFAGRAGAGNVAPANNYNAARISLDLDRVVNENGVSQASSNHMMLNPGQGPNLRDGATDPNMAGPLGATILQMMTDPTNGRVLDSWYDADGAPQGDAGNFVN